jgi:RNA polymerase primary sigma factor
METLPPNRAKRRKAISKKDFQLEVSMMNHDLLSKDEEYELSRLYHTAKQLQTRIDVLLSEKNLQLEARQKLSGNGGDNSKGFPDKTKTNDFFVGEEESPEASHSPDSDAFISYRNYEEWQQIDAHPKSITAKSTMLERMDQSSRTTMAAYFFNDSDEYVDPKELSTTFAAELTEEDIVSSLQIPGGRKEMESILLNGASARDTLIRSNLKLVSSICKRWARIFSKSGSDSNDSLFSIYSGGWDRPSLSEATQEGVIGLATAVERFDPSRGLRFSTYATYWITNSVRQCFQRSSTGCLRLPINYYDTRTRFKTLVRQYYEMDGSVPSMDVLARELGLPERRLQLILSLTQPLVSMDGLLRPKGGLTRAGKAGNVNRLEDNLLLSDTLPDASSDRADYSSNPMDRVELSFLRQQLEHAMAVELVPFERDVLRLRLGLDDGVMRTCREVAVECGGRLKSSEIRSTEQRALKKLRSPVALATYKLLTYLDFADVDIKTISLR